MSEDGYRGKMAVLLRVLSEDRYIGASAERSLLLSDAARRLETLEQSLATAQAEAGRLREACNAALAHAGQCLCCRANYEAAIDTSSGLRPVDHDADCYIALCRKALGAPQGAEGEKK